MAGSGQDPSQYRALSRDHIGRNSRVTNNLQVPVYSNVTTCYNPVVLPPVSHEGQLIYDVVSRRLLVSTLNETGSLHWQALVYASCDA
jgi:hypothetical protein